MFIEKKIFDLQLTIALCVTLLKNAETYGTHNGCARMTDDDVWVFADSDTKRNLERKLQNDFERHGGLLRTAKNCVFYKLSEMKQNSVIAYRAPERFSYKTHDIDEILISTVRALLKFTDLSGIDEYGNLMPDFELSLLDEYAGEDLWLSREDLRFALPCCDLNEYTTKRMLSCCGWKNNMKKLGRITAPNCSSFDGLAALDELAALDDLDALYEYPKVTFSKDFSSHNYQRLIIVANAIKRCANDPTKNHGFDMEDVVLAMPLESALAFHHNDIDNELMDLEDHGAIDISVNYDVSVNAKALDEYEDEVLLKWLESDLLVEGLEPDGSLIYGDHDTEEPMGLYTTGFTMENVATDNPIIISPIDFEEAAMAFVSHGNTLDGYCCED